MVGVKTTFGLLATLAVVSVALPGTQWSKSGGGSNGVDAGSTGGGAGGQGVSNGYYAGGAGGGSGGQGFGEGKGFEGANGQGGGHGDPRAGGNGEQGRGGSESGGTHGSAGNSHGGANRRHEDSGNPNDNHGTSGTGTGDGRSWDHMGNNAGQPTDHEGQASRGGGGSGANKPGGIHARDDEADAIKDTVKVVYDPNEKHKHARSSEDEQNETQNPDDDQADVDLNEFSRRWAQAVEDDDAPDIRFQFDSDHPYAQVHTLNTRDAGLGVYECANRMYTPPCHFQEVVAGQCYNRMYNEYGSMSPDKGVVCSLYETTNCNMGHTQAGGGQWSQLNNVVYPGIPVYQNYTALQLLGMHTKGPISWKCQFTLTPKVQMT